MYLAVIHFIFRMHWDNIESNGIESIHLIELNNIIITSSLIISQTPIHPSIHTSIHPTTICTMSEGPLQSRLYLKTEWRDGWMDGLGKSLIRKRKNKWHDISWIQDMHTADEENGTTNAMKDFNRNIYETTSRTSSTADIDDLILSQEQNVSLFWMGCCLYHKLAVRVITSPSSPFTKI